MDDLHSKLAKQLSHASGPTPAGLTGHDVGFYRTDETLVKSVVEFLAAGIRVGQPIIVISTDRHRRVFAAFRRVCDHHTGARLLDDLRQSVA